MMKAKKTVGYFPLFMALFFLVSCKEEFKQCVSVWSDCKENCPEVSQEDIEKCQSRCVPPDDLTDFKAMMAYNTCLVNCAAAEYLARERCLEGCDEDLRQCVDEIGA
ncbi:MAG: hypothetical protein AAGB24_16380 [Bacteroidota bacterium]